MKVKPIILRGAPYRHATITVTVRQSLAFRWRLIVGLALMRCAARVLGCGLDVKHEA